MSLRVLTAQVAPPSGSVAGVVTCGDTQRPARFAKVTLTPVKTEQPDLKGLADKGAKDDPAAAMKMIGTLMNSVTMLQSQTALDGSFTIIGVAPGDYYLMATAPGYVSPAAASEAAAGADASSSKKMAGVPVVHVEANRASRGDAVMQRGAALNGTVLFDDGSPAAGVVVKFENAAKNIKKSPKENGDVDIADFSQSMSRSMAGALAATITDDRGRFRLAGVPPGDYVVQASVVVHGGFSMRAGVMDLNEAKAATPIFFYAPGALHRKDAETFTVRAAEERSDIEIKVDLSPMRSVSGHVASAVDHHLLNAGTVTLVDATDKSVKRLGSVDATGSFTVSYLAPGTYTLEVSDGADTEPSRKKPGSVAFVRFAAPHTVRSYEDATQSVIVAASDVTGVNVELKESKTVKKDFDMNEILGAGKGRD